MLFRSFQSKMADEADPVVHEVDVYLSKSLAENLYLLQYLVRPSHLTYEDIKPLSVKVKPTQKEIEIQLPVNTKSNNYAFSKGEQMALMVDGRYKPSEQNFFDSNVMDKTILASGPSSVSTHRYAVGIYKDNEFHLTPLYAMAQVRPSFSYMDRADAKQKLNIKQSEGGESSQEEEEEEAKPVRLKFARHETVEAKARRMASYDYYQKKRDEEQWVDLRYHSRDDDRSLAERNMLFATKNHDISEFNIPPWEYLEKLMPPVTEEEEEKPALPSNILSLSQLRTMPLQDQVKALLINAKVIRFRQLLALLPQGTDSTAVIRCLQQVAVLVQGCWVVKSEILYPKDATSPHSGVSAEHLCRGRDYLMWKFLHTRYVTRKEISSVIKLPAEDVKDILEQMSRVRVSHGWEFLFDYDKEFCSRYPEIIQRQKVLWEAKFQSLCKQLKINCKEIEKKHKEQTTPEKCKKPRTPTKSRKRTMSGRSISDHSDIEPEGTDRAAANKDGLDDNCVEILDITGDGAFTNEGGLRPSTGVGNSKGSVSFNNHVFNHKEDVLQGLQSFVKDKLNTRYVLTMSEVKRLFQLNLTQSQPGHILSSGVSDQMLEQAVLDVGGIRLNDRWPKQYIEEPVFLASRIGDGLDPMRGVLIGMLQTSCRVASNLFKKKVDEVLDCPISENDCKKLLRDYCITKGSCWYLKGVNTEES
ncbi:DNA-directed RNA polymerase III subunit RPC5 [Octopus sinensis]|uniref:DNA-directed RNA polymerase III subunit RPC5 n=1 Tax=Octopus sinensis TaxID=2607531 RepID=A0A6P7TEA8_9MOLL|nr:DNA-directed RNA polymerase III subunit RPC5 [Octopus sinensis]